ncbi:MAG TPA: hypothetical protein VJV23_13425 [Candidatus Polarisedimenticolia bacterium]|nr:hypothetical protein [Candidatus Polarisedimenticolia bacterium]
MPQMVGQGDGVGVSEGRPGGGKQVQLRLDSGELGGLEQTVEQRRHLGAALRPGAVVILAAHDHTSESALGDIVVKLEDASRFLWKKSWRDLVLTG